jgi:hypothetical protein
MVRAGVEEGGVARFLQLLCVEGATAVYPTAAVQNQHHRDLGRRAAAVLILTIEMASSWCLMITCLDGLIFGGKLDAMIGLNLMVVLHSR